jgi:hypothetical protein
MVGVCCTREKIDQAQEWQCIAGYLTHLRHIDFCHQSASAMTIPSGLALE